MRTMPSAELTAFVARQQGERGKNTNAHNRDAYQLEAHVLWRKLYVQDGLAALDETSALGPSLSAVERLCWGRFFRRSKKRL